jgi:hypothetical protein
MVERSVAERIARDIADALTLTELETHLGIRRKVLLKIVGHNVIPFWVKGGIIGQRGYLFAAPRSRIGSNACWRELQRFKSHRLAPLAWRMLPYDCRIPAVAFFNAVAGREIPVRGILGALVPIAISEALSWT